MSVLTIFYPWNHVNKCLTATLVLAKIAYIILLIQRFYSYFWSQISKVYIRPDKYITAPTNTVTGDQLIWFPNFCQNTMLCFTTVQRFIDELYLCLVAEQKSRPMGKVTKESLLLVTLWVAMVTMYHIQGANSLTRSIEGVCDAVYF